MRLKIEPAANIVVGQTVRLSVTILVPNYFMGSPDFPEFELKNAIVVLSHERPQNVNEQIGGVSYAGIVQQYLIYPEMPGEFRLPAAEVGVRYAGEKGLPYEDYKRAMVKRNTGSVIYIDFDKQPAGVLNSEILVAARAEYQTVLQIRDSIDQQSMVKQRLISKMRKRNTEH